MARANFVKSAQKTIYRYGTTVSYESKRGKKAGQMKSKVDRTIPQDANDPIVIAKGESYYWWQFKNSSKQFSKTRPKPSQLTQSNYLSTLYGIQESLEDITASNTDELQEAVDDIKTQLEELRDTTQESLDNMPDSLQSSPTGELLQERIDALENAISEVEGIDTDYDEPDDDEIRGELADDVEYTPTDEEEENDDFDIDEKKKELVTDEQIQEKKEELEQEWVDERLDELKGISFD